MNTADPQNHRCETESLTRHAGALEKFRAASRCCWSLKMMQAERVQTSEDDASRLFCFSACGVAGKLLTLSVILVILILDVGPVHGFVSPIAHQSEISSEQIRDAANQVMQQKDFRGVRRRVLENIRTTEGERGFLRNTLGSMGTAVGDFFDWIFSGLFSSRPKPAKARARAPATPPPASSSSSSGFDFDPGKLLLFMGLTVLVGVSIWLLASVMKKSDPNRKLDRRGLFGDEQAITDLTTPPGELAASTYESRAILMASEGNYRAAVRELLIGSMSWIERAGLIRFRKGLTNRDYVRAVWKKEDQRNAYARTALEFERIYFGRRDATSEMFENCLKSFQGNFREEEATTTTV